MIAPRSILRGVWRCTGWLAVGFVITVAVSWGLAVVVSQREWTPRRFHVGASDEAGRRTALSIDEFHGIGRVQRAWYIGSRQKEAKHIEHASGIPSQSPATWHGEVAPPLGWPRWGQSPELLSAWFSDRAFKSRRVTGWVLSQTVRQGCEDATGWPALAMYHKVVLARGIVPQISGGFGAVSAAGSIKLDEVRVLPLTPIWPGLALDSVFWGAAALAVVHGPRTVRAALRRRRGLCPACAYPVGASPVCTECGTAVRPTLQETQATA